MTSPHKRRKRAKNAGSNVDLADRLHEWGESYGLEEDPYLEGLGNAIREGKNLAIWASNEVMTLMPHPDVDSVEGPIYSAMVLIRNVLVFVPVALTWLAVGKATSSFSIYTAKSSAASVVNFLQFWQNGYGILAKTWTLSHIAEDDFYIIATVILLTFITPFMNRSAIKKVAGFERDALRERLALVIEVESFLFDKRRLTPLTIDSSLAQSFERVVEATRNLAMASKRIEHGLMTMPKEVAPEGQGVDHGIVEHKEEANFIPGFDNSLEKHESQQIADAADSLESITKRVDVIVQSLPRRAHARKELKKVETELEVTRNELEHLQGKLSKQQKKKVAKQNELKAAKREAERARAMKKTKESSKIDPYRSEYS